MEKKSETLGSIIANRRKELEISQRELARAVLISNSTISRIENDDNITPDTATIKALSEYLKLDYNYLLALNHSIDNQPEIRIIQRAAKNMDESQLQDMMEILKRAFWEEFKDVDEDKF